MSQLRKDAFAIYKKTWIESWMIGLLSGILIAGLFALNMLVNSIWMIITPLIVLPLLFAAIMSHMGLKFNRQLTFGSTLKEMALFYRAPFNSSFSYLAAFFRSILIFLGFMLIGSTYSFFLTSLMKPGLSEAMAELEKIATEVTTITTDTIDNLLSMNDYAIFTYLLMLLMPAFFFQSITLIYFITRNATGVYFRNNVKSGNPNFLKAVQNYVYSRYRMPMFKKYMALNWPMLVLFSLGYVGTAVLATFYSKSIFFIAGASLTGGVLLMSFYFPFYLCNMEAIYAHSNTCYAEGLDYVTKQVMQSMEINLKMQEEQKRKMEEFLKRTQIHKDNDKVVDEKEDQDKEKDPPSES